MKKKSHKGLVIGLFAPLLTLLLAAGFFFGVNRFSVRMELIGETGQTLECGVDSYTEEGAQARFCGSLVFRKGFALDVHKSGSIDDARTGEQTVTYTAGFLLWHGKARRAVTVQDTTPPELTLVEKKDSYTAPGTPYQEDGYTATDLCDGDLTDQVRRVEKDGKVYYSVTDRAGNTTERVRTINYKDVTPPEITLKGDAEITLKAGTPFTDPGATAIDNRDGDVTEKMTVEGGVDVYRAGDYTITYRAADSFGNESEAKRTVHITPIRQPDTVVPDGKVVYLTFDDGPSKYTSELLDVLAKYNVKATFFIVNIGYTDLISRELNEGHSVGIHSATHQYSTIYASEEAYFADLQKVQDAIVALSGKETTLVRFPGGSSNTVSRFNPGIMTRLTQALTDMGYQYFDWNVSSGDAGETTSTDQVFENVTSGMRSHNVSIVLQHDIKGFSVAAVERIIVWGLANGYTFLPLDATSPTAHHRVNN